MKTGDYMIHVSWFNELRANCFWRRVFAASRFSNLVFLGSLTFDSGLDLHNEWQKFQSTWSVSELRHTKLFISRHAHSKDCALFFSFLLKSFGLNLRYFWQLVLRWTLWSQWRHAVRRNTLHLRTKWLAEALPWATGRNICFSSPAIS